MRAWTLRLARRSKDAWLARAVDAPELALGAELRRAFRIEAKAPPRAGRRVAELRATAEEKREEGEKSERLAREKAKKPAEAGKKKRLDALAARHDAAWADLEAKTDRNQYDAATKLAIDLRDLARRDGLEAPFAKSVEAMRKRELRRRGFFDRWRRHAWRRAR